ncbi:hypothetical protein [Hyphomicrobium sp.]|jgi:hypothetical protein|uniref:hypothetical protein n=1 Tax=Hyphomicrobium sp. TaxID=82 RepID=UPI002C8A3FE7|nr:hypothetical protein [Hyphomicrobium sp.]HVZ04734.1 hypothetical protein [Hyphomicrobium sp.]
MLVSMAKTVGRSGIVAIALLAGLQTASAQQKPAPAAGVSTHPDVGDDGAPAQDDVKQIKLTDDQVKHFIAAQSDLAAIASKLQDAGDKPDPALQAELEGIATKHGFGNFAELDDVAANISIVMAGLDSKTGDFVDPVEALKKERDDVQKDSSIPDTDKKQLMDELTEAISTTPKLQYKENIDIVKAHKAEIEKALQ